MLEILSTDTNSTGAVLLLKTGGGLGGGGRQVAKVWSNHNGLEEYNAVTLTPISLQKPLERVCWKKIHEAFVWKSVAELYWSVYFYISWM